MLKSSFMTALFGFMHAKEQSPLSTVGHALKQTVESLDEVNARGIVQGKAGTVAGICFAVPRTEAKHIDHLKQTKPFVLPESVGQPATLKQVGRTATVNWYTLFWRAKSPESISPALQSMQLEFVPCQAALSIMTTRDRAPKINPVDSSAPLVASDVLIGASIGHITKFLRDVSLPGLEAGSIDGKKLLRAVCSGMKFGMGNELVGRSNGQYVFLKKYVRCLPYTLHLAFFDPLLEYMHVVRSPEYKGLPRKLPVLWAGKSTNGNFLTIARNPDIFPKNNSPISAFAPEENTVRTLFLKQ